jgi:hypothetical protein
MDSSTNSPDQVNVRQPASLDPRRLSHVPPPPMIVIHKGWWADRTTERQATELAAEDREQRKFI